MAVLELLQVVRVREDSPEYGLAQGTIGAVVDLLRDDGEAYEIEVVDEGGRTMFLGALPAGLLEPVTDHDEKEGGSVR